MINRSRGPATPTPAPQEAAASKTHSPAPESRAPWKPNPIRGDERLQYGLRPDVVAQRKAAGRRALLEPSERPLEAPPSYFRGYREIRDALYALEKRYPELVQVDVVGPSGEKERGVADRDILRLRLTQKAKPNAEKAKLLYTGGIHAREISNPELLMSWLEQVLENYGKDAEATALLDGRVIDIVPMGNPDGHRRVEESYEGRGGNRMQRKNTSPPSGTDGNRNFSFEWGGPGASRFPWSQTYRGEGPASEAETRAIESLYTKTDYDLVIDWHSHSELVLFPWGHTREKAPDYEGLKRVAERFASFNGYSPIQSVELYPTSGTSDGPAYGERRIPAFVIETGTSFHQSDEEHAQVKRETHPVMTYAAQIADEPYENAKGPMINAVKVEDGRVVVDGTSSLSPTTARELLLQPKTTEVELVLDPKTPKGEGIPLSRSERASERFVAELPRDVSESPAGTIAYVRAKDSRGDWGVARAFWLRSPNVA